MIGCAGEERALKGKGVDSTWNSYCYIHECIKLLPNLLLQNNIALLVRRINLLRYCIGSPQPLAIESIDQPIIKFYDHVSECFDNIPRGDLLS
jgi:hypothetical protein